MALASVPARSDERPHEEVVAAPAVEAVAHRVAVGETHALERAASKAAALASKTLLPVDWGRRRAGAIRAVARWPAGAPAATRSARSWTTAGVRCSTTIARYRARSTRRAQLGGAGGGAAAARLPARRLNALAAGAHVGQAHDVRRGDELVELDVLLVAGGALRGHQPRADGAG